MNRLRIVVEETGPDAYEVKYVGTDFAKADAALREPTDKDRALYNKPQPVQYNRPTIAVQVAPVATVTETLSTELPDKSKSQKKSK